MGLWGVMGEKSSGMELFELGNLIEGAWCIGGDFNEILNLHDRLGCTRTYEIAQIPGLGG